MSVGIRSQLQRHTPWDISYKSDIKGCFLYRLQKNLTFKIKISKKFEILLS